MQTFFGAGAMWGTPVTDALGNTVANPTPIKFGILQEVTLDVEFTTKQLYGGNQFPAQIGRGQGKITGNAKNAQIEGAMFAQLFFGQSSTQGAVIGAYQDVTGIAIPTTPYQVTITPPSSGVFKADLGVLDSNAEPMTAVASAPATGQYAVNPATGQYTFAAADTGKVVYISYSYTATATANGSQKSTVLSEPMGYSSTFALDLLLAYKGQQLTLHLYQCTSTKLALQTKLEDFMIPEFSFEAFADTQNRVMDWSTTG